jgi:hypothetical protein
MPLEELHFALMALGRFPRGKGAEIAPLARARIFFAGVEAILS